MQLLAPPEKLSEDHYAFKIKTSIDQEIVPGQFINIKVTPHHDPLLRRPFSIFDYENGIIQIIVKIAGRGTSFLKDYAHPGEIDVLGPLGKGFTLVENSKVLLIGGGVGNAPLHFLSKELKKRNCLIYYIYGSRAKKFIYCKDNYCNLADHFISTTDDGSDGKKGFVTDELQFLLASEHFDFIYICGPTPMMKNSVALLKEHPSPVEVSMENYFGCGIGICSGCTVYTTQGQKRACVDGPVFNGKIIEWE